MEETQRFWFSRSGLLYAATACAIIAWAAKDAPTLGLCLLFPAMFYGCVKLLQISVKAAETDVGDED